MGLRRKEIDLLEWDSFLWDAGVVRVQLAQHFDPKTEDSLGDVAVDSELLELFRGYRARAIAATRKTVPTKRALRPPIIATALPPARPFSSA